LRGEKTELRPVRGMGKRQEQISGERFKGKKGTMTIPPGDVLRRNGPSLEEAFSNGDFVLETRGGGADGGGEKRPCPTDQGIFYKRGHE